jgi:hypothetical protein
MVLRMHSADLRGIERKVRPCDARFGACRSLLIAPNSRTGCDDGCGACSPMTAEPGAEGVRPPTGIAHPPDTEGRVETLRRSEPPTGRSVPPSGGGHPPIVLTLNLLNGFRLARACCASEGSRAAVGVHGTHGEACPTPRRRNSLGRCEGRTGPRVPPHALWRLGRLCPGALAATPESIDISDDVVVDVRQFRAVARMLIDHQLPSGADHYAFVDLMKMDLLPGWYDDWVILERERLRQLRLSALEALSAQLLGHGEYASALEAALVAIAAEPMRESAQRAAALIHFAEGNIVEALQQYEAYQQMMSVELGASPSREFANLVGREEVPTPHQRRGHVSCRQGESAVPPADIILKAISDGPHPLHERPVASAPCRLPVHPGRHEPSPSPAEVTCS